MELFSLVLSHWLNKQHQLERLQVPYSKMHFNVWTEHSQQDENIKPWSPFPRWAPEWWGYAV